MTDVYILSSVRTPIGKFLGGLSGFTAPQLGAKVVGEAGIRSRIPGDEVEEVFLGCALQAGVGQNPARQAALGAGLPNQVGCVTINKVCGSGLKSVILAAQAIRAGDIRIAIAGGMESMSNAPYLLPDARQGMRLRDAPLVDAILHDGLRDATNGYPMGITGELVAEKYGITREAMDRYALRSHEKAAAAEFGDEILPIEATGRKGETRLVETDEGVRPDVKLEKLASLRPAFQKNGVVTPGNASQISDGAAALVLASGEEVKRRKAEPLARITGYAVAGLDPKWVMMTPVEALKKLEEKCGIRAGDVDLLEINEAFAAQACAILQETKLDPEKVNVHGGAVALGHPIGASGARILVTLLNALRIRKQKTGIATLCMGGGNGLAPTSPP